MEYVFTIIGLPKVSLKKAFAPLGIFALHIHDHFIPSHRNNYHPHILGHRALVLMSVLLVSLKIFTISLIAFGPAVPAFSSAISVNNIISLTNQSRQGMVLPVLRENPLLDQAAQTKADDMLARSYFSHTTPDGRTPWTFIIAAGYNYLMAGENLAVNFTDAESVETAWMNSPGHRANILNKNYEEIGIGISQGTYQDHNAIFVVQMFGTPAAQPVTLSEQPTVVQTTPAPAPASQPVKIKVTSTVPQNASQPQTLGEVKNAAPPAPPAASPLLPVTIQRGDVQLAGEDVKISAQVSGPAVKVFVYFGEQAVMLSPQSDGLWNGQIPISSLAQTNSTVRVRAIAMEGQASELQLADFAPTTIDNYSLNATTPSSYINIMGYNFDPKSFENRFYLFFIAALLTSLILAIAIKRHIQHLPLIANSSFVIILACLLWMGG